MKVKVKEIVEILEQFAPNEVQESWDNSGYNIGSPERVVTKVLLALDCTEEVVEEAEQIGAELIITHHPLLFKGLKRITGESYIERAVAKLIKSDITLYSIHTNIDKVIGGVSGLMADKLALKEREILSEEGQEGYGLGVVGLLPEAMEVLPFLEMVKEKFQLKQLRTSAPIEGKIERVALCGGSGSSLIEAAERWGADIYLTGDISYHNFFCEEGFMLADMGHYESEIAVLDLLEALILKKLANFDIYKSYNNPIYYY